jgi:hypothetical protein
MNPGMNSARAWKLMPALFDPQHHPLAVYGAATLQMGSFGNTQAGRVTGRQDRAILETLHTVEETGGDTSQELKRWSELLTNLLHRVDALRSQADTRVLLPSGTVFREQYIVLTPDRPPAPIGSIRAKLPPLSA